MTCEVAVMNKRGVALAADSAVTFAPEQKVYYSAEKLFQLSSVAPIDSLSMTSLFYCKINQAAFLRKSSGNAISLRAKDAAIICFPRSVTLHRRERGILAISL
jgi:hypothetical protein